MAQLKKEVRFCPSCSLYYTERPAVSRKDSRILICPDCGMKEALADYSFAKIFGPTMAIFEQARREAEGCGGI